jgi:hypothetical protein
VLAPLKNNLAAPQSSLAFEVVTPEGGAPRLNWLGPVEVTADALLTPARRPGPNAERRDAAAAFLERVLADGPLPARQVWKVAQQEGFSFITLRRAKTHLAVASEFANVNGIPISYWLLPGQQLPATEPQAEPDEVIERLRQLEEHYPPRSPLDDL